SPSVGQFSGYAWSNNLGWLSFNQSDVSGCFARGVRNDATPAKILTTPEPNGAYPVIGWGRFLSGGDIASDDFDGCVSFRSYQNTVYVNPTTGLLEGFAWGDHPVVGWLNSINVSIEIVPPDDEVCNDPTAINYNQIGECINVNIS